MDTEKLLKLLTQLQGHQISVDEAITKLRSLPFDDIDGYARIDNHRTLRQGMP